MKRAVYVGLSLLFGASASLAQTKGWVLATVTDWGKKETLQVMSLADFKKLQEEIEAANRYYPKALAAAQKAWKEAEDLKNKAFPSSAIAPRRAGIEGIFPDEEKANLKLADVEKKAQERESREATREKEKQKGQKQNKDQTARKAREAEKDTERERLNDQARQIFEDKLRELMPQSEAAAPEPGKTEPKKDEPKKNEAK